MKKQRLYTRFVLFSVILLFALTFTVSCSSADKASGNYNGKDSYYSNSSSGIDYEKGEGDGGIGTLPTGGQDNPNAKIIKTANAAITTLEYDSFIEKLYLKITELEGYTDSESFSGSSPYRYASIVVRIPAEKLDSFKTELSVLGTLTYYSATKDDVTLTYSTLKAKVETLTLEAEAVEELFIIAKEKGDLNEISSLQSKLYDLRLEINEANAKLATYDNSIAYSKISLSINEAKEYIEPEPEEEKGAFERIFDNLKNNFKDIGTFFVEFFVWFVSAIPYLILFGFIGTGAAFIIIKIRKRKLKKEKTDAEDSESFEKDDTPKE